MILNINPDPTLKKKNGYESKIFKVRIQIWSTHPEPNLQPWLKYYLGNNLIDLST